jgi:tight adherence protein B
LDRAGISLRVGEFLAISVVVGVFLAVLAHLLLPAGFVNILGMVLALLVGLLIPHWILSRQMRRRRGQIEAALPDALDILARSMRAGNGLLISIDALVEQVPGPLSAEFGRMRQEIAVGVSTEEAFAELDRRVDSKDLHIIVTAVIVQREVGGNLAEILSNVASTIRERFMLRREVQALTAQERWATYIVAAVPPLILIAFSFIQPELITSLLSHTAGWIVLGVAGVLELTGYLVLRWLVASFEV